MTPLYSRFTGASREQFSTLAEARAGFALHWNEDFNFAYDVLDALAAETPDALCLLHIDNDGRETRVTFAEMKRLSDKAANVFADAGIRKGDVTLLVLGRKLQFWACLLGLHKLGATCVQATHMLTAKDYAYRCEAADIKAAVVMGEGDCARQFALGAGEKTPVRFITGGKAPGFLDFDGLLEAASEQWSRVPTKATDRMLILFSSGTSGYPKMVAHDFTYPLGHIVTAVYWQRVQPGGLHFTISDTGWGKALWGKIYGQWLGGSAVLVYDFMKFDARAILSVMERTRVTTFCVPPTMYRMLLQCDLSKYDLSSLTHCATAGEALGPEIFNAWKQATGLAIHEGFGQTETPLILATLAPYNAPVPGAIGLPVPGFEVFVLDDGGNECEQGVTGEICIRAESAASRPRGLTTGYYKNEAATQSAWHDGFYHTGDTAYRDERGLYHYVGRNDDIIKSSGYRIGPFEVESALLAHPAVLECAVTGVPDALRGFAVKATIKLKPGFAPSDELVKDIQNFVKRSTAPYKYPRVVAFVDALPKTFNGKILRNEIRKADLEKATRP